MSSRQQHNYELLGAPVLLFRNRAAYTSLDQSTASVSLTTVRHYRRQQRVHARWYYPLDFHRVQMAEAETFLDNNASAEDDGSSSVSHYSSSNEETTEEANMDRLERIASRYKELQKQFPSQSPTEDSPNNYLSHQARRRRHLLRHHNPSLRQALLHAYRRKDVTTFPARLMIGPKHAVFRFTGYQQQQLRRYAAQRIDHADPAYLAPWQPGTWMHASALAGTGRSNDNPIHSIPARGNTIVSFPCRCPVCTASDHHRVWWILHAVGPLQETIRLSQLALPGASRTVWRGQKFSNSRVVTNAAKDGTPGRPVGLDTGDYVRELVQCGDNTFVARGDCYISVFRVVPADVRNSPPADDLCLGGSYTPVLVERVDLRSLARNSFSYTPRSMAAHPRYGGLVSDGRVAVVSELESHSVHNCVHQYILGDEVRWTKHTIDNLQFISNLQYSSNHPMVLWSCARSFIRPVPTRDHFKGTPKVGFGTSLFAIDLRTNKASFQWSPSADSFVVEGVHSLSGLLTDWESEHRLFTTSISARKTYDIDTRMPCRPVTTWSLPHFTEGASMDVNKFGAFGTGMILQTPAKLNQEDSHQPILAVNTTPGAAVVHLYQHPNRSPRFQCAPTESVYTPGLNSLPVSVATSLSFPLPDISASVATCGLTSFHIPTKELFSSTVREENEAILQYAPSTLCVVTCTTKGDLYAHPLLVSSSDVAMAKSSDAMPPGCVSVPAPRDYVVLDREAPVNWLPLNLSNEFPVPSSAIVVPLDPFHESYQEETLPWIPRVQDNGDMVVVTPAESQSLSLSGDGHDNIVGLEANMLEDQQATFSSTMDCFHRNLVNVQRRQMRQERFSERTDMTEAVIENVEYKWDDSGYGSGGSG